jgi:integrase/recombinase XerD
MTRREKDDIIGTYVLIEPKGDVIMSPPRMVEALLPDRGRMFYLIDAKLDFIPEVKEFLDWKAATRRAPATIEAYCFRLCWFYRFLDQRGLNILEATPADLTEFVIWLCNPHRDVANLLVKHEPRPLQETSINLVLQAVGALYHFLVRRGILASSPMVYVEVPKGKWLTERDLLAHTRRGSTMVQRMELKLKKPNRLLPTISEKDFQVFLDSIHIDQKPNNDPCGFRDRLICLMLKEGGFRLGELSGMRLEDLAFGEQGVHVRFRANNENGARAKSGYGHDRFVHLPTDVLGLLDVYITEVWIEANPRTDHLWIVLKKEAKDRDGHARFGAALTLDAVEKMFQHYSKKSGVTIYPHALRHTHASELVRSYLRDGEPVDWKFIQERLGHASVVTTMQTYTHLTGEDRKLAYDSYLERKKRHGTASSGPNSTTLD